MLPTPLMLLPLLAAYTMPSGSVMPSPPFTQIEYAPCACRSLAPCIAALRPLIH